MRCEPMKPVAPVTAIVLNSMLAVLFCFVLMIGWLVWSVVAGKVGREKEIGEEVEEK